MGNLPFKVEENEVRSFFESCGDILNVRIIRDPKTREGKGFGYIFFKEKSGLKQALAMNNETLLKRVIRVKKAVSAEDLEEKVAAAALALYAEKPVLTTSEKAEKRKAAKVAKTEAMEVEESSSKSSVRKIKRLDAVPLKDMLKISNINFLENENDVKLNCPQHACRLT